MTQSPFVQARERAEAGAETAQDLNRLWWENLPMTYVAWEADDRRLTGREAFVGVQARFLADNPWLVQYFDFGRFAGREVLEIGCGSGAASCLLAKAGASVAAVDLTEAAVRMSKACAAASDVRVAVNRMDAERLAFDADRFDFVFSWGVLHHSSDTVAAFREVARVLRPGGSGLIMVYNRASLRYYLKGLYWLLLKGRLFKGDSLRSVQRFFTDGYYHRHFAPGELASCLSGVGLTPTRVAVTHMNKTMIPFLPRRLDEYLKARFGWLLVVEFTKVEARSHDGT